VNALRAARRANDQGIVVISATDPLNLVGVVTPGSRIAAQARTRIAFVGGEPAAVVEGGRMTRLAQTEATDAQLEAALRGGGVPRSSRPRTWSHRA
jgi:ATP-dependent Lhr-like helicase